jgi:hypothetical protein
MADKASLSGSKRGSFSNMAKREATIEDLYRVPDKFRRAFSIMPAEQDEGMRYPTTSDSLSTFPIADRSVPMWPSGPADR